ncbi:MAG: PhzF family phenazine biosynthesis protein, partial [Salinisphaeraceae bacterium]|nr:PhzF family phenazine biosynthesis protein [Salinisphaeraceae bacterium]
LSAWLDEPVMQAIAAENNLAETAFFVPEPEGSEADFHLRWFTPTVEVELCGHATLATAWLLFNELGYAGDTLRFASRSGVLLAERAGDTVRIDLPARESKEIDCPADLAAGLGAQPQAVRSGANLIAVFESESDIRNIQPDFPTLARLHPQGVIVTAAGDEVDVVSRFFGPSFGINEDPVTGSAHADLAPYWCERLGREQFQAKQLSARMGELDVALSGQRVLLTGGGVLYLRGSILI